MTNQKKRKIAALEAAMRIGLLKKDGSAKIAIDIVNKDKQEPTELEMAFDDLSYRLNQAGVYYDQQEDVLRFAAKEMHMEQLEQGNRSIGKSGRECYKKIFQTVGLTLSEEVLDQVMPKDILAELDKALSTLSELMSEDDTDD